MDVTFFEHLSYYTTNDLQGEISRNEDTSWYDTPVVLSVVLTVVQDKAAQAMDGEMNEQSEPIFDTQGELTVETPQRQEGRTIEVL